MDKTEQKLQDDLKTAMRARDERLVGIYRFVLASIKQVKVDQRKELTEAEVLAILDKSAKKLRESIEQYKKANRDDLVAKEAYELEVLQRYMPAPLSDEEAIQIIKQAIADSGAQSIRDMGKAMQIAKDKAAGRIDMTVLSTKVKELLSK